jgi:sugar/nucleoside kinase (ribokinase family)
MKRLLGIGNALVDILVRIEDDNLLSELGLRKGGMTLIDEEMMRAILAKIRFLSQKKASGGSAANSVNGLARLGVGTGFVGVIGDDEFGHFFESDLRDNLVETLLSRGTLETGKSISLISKDTERTMATYLGAAGEFHCFRSDIDIFRKYQYLLIEAYLIPDKNLVEGIFRSAKQVGTKIAIDFSSFTVVEENRDFLDYLLKKYVDIALANEDEARTFTGRQDPADALEYLAGHCELAVVKCGAGGSLIRHNTRQIVVDPIRAEAIDTTGAGDLYTAGFFYGLIHEFPLEVCGKLGALLGGKVVEVVGARMPDGKWEEVFKQMKLARSV